MELNGNLNSPATPAMSRPAAMSLAEKLRQTSDIGALWVYAEEATDAPIRQEAVTKILSLAKGSSAELIERMLGLAARDMAASVRTTALTGLVRMFELDRAMLESVFRLGRGDADIEVRMGLNAALMRQIDEAPVGVAIPHFQAIEDYLLDRAENDPDAAVRRAILGWALENSKLGTALNDLARAFALGQQQAIMRTLMIAAAVGCAIALFLLW